MANTREVEIDRSGGWNQLERTVVGARVRIGRLLLGIVFLLSALPLDAQRHENIRAVWGSLEGKVGTLQGYSDGFFQFVIATGKVSGKGGAKLTSVGSDYVVFIEEDGDSRRTFIIPMTMVWVQLREYK